MPTVTIYPTAAGTVRSSHGTFATMVVGANLVMHTSNTNLRVGQIYLSSVYYGYETFLEFDLSSIPSGSTINSVAFQMVVAERYSFTGTMYLGSVPNFGTIDTADWRSRTALQALTPIATHAHSGSTPAVNSAMVFTEVSTSLRAWVAAAAGGTAYSIVWNEYLENDAGSASNLVYGWYPEDDATPARRPALDIDYTAPASGIPAHLMRTQHYGPRGLTGNGGPFNG